MRTQQHYAVLDGMRGVAALIVLVFHVAQTHGTTLPYAPLAVDFFFMMSGFVVAYAYESRLQSTLGFGSFVRIRLTRLYPLIVLGVSAGIALTVLHWHLLHDISLRQVAISAILGLAILPCYVFPQWDTVFPMNLPSWSLFFELTINGVYALLARHLSTRRLVVLTALSGAVLVLSSVYVGNLQGYGYNQVGFWMGFVRVAFPFFAGVLLYRFRRPVSFAPCFGLNICVVLAALLLVPVGGSSAGCLIYVIALFPVVIFLGSSVSVGARLTHVFLFAGRMSYPIYITHQPFLRAFSQISGHLHIDGPLFYSFEVAVCLVAAYCALRFFDEPVRAWLNRVGRPPAASAGPAMTAVVDVGPAAG